jgi:hypothetical protein
VKIVRGAHRYCLSASVVLLTDVAGQVWRAASAAKFQAWIAPIGLAIRAAFPKHRTAFARNGKTDFKGLCQMSQPRAEIMAAMPLRFPSVTPRHERMPKWSQICRPGNTNRLFPSFKPD